MYKALGGTIFAATIALTPATAEAQDWRTISSRRQAAGEEELRVDVRFGAGTLRVRPADAGDLYTLSLRYDADRIGVTNRYDDGVLTVALENERRIQTRIRESARLELGLGPEVPVDLGLSFGAAEADVELGGVRARRITVSTGASDSKLHFSSPNPTRLERLKIEAGAASLQATGLGNAHVEQVDVSGGVGSIVLDFTGEWRGDTRAKIELGLGSLTLRLPRGLGVRVNRETFLMTFDSQELVRRGDSYYSQNWEDAANRLTVEISGAFGSIDVQWVDEII